MYKLKKEFTICCSHRLVNKNYSDEQNEIWYGKCNLEPGHGHNYKVILKLKTHTLPETGMIINFNEVKRIFKDVIDDRFDHKFLNNDTLFKNHPATAEYMCEVFYHLLKLRLDELYEIEIFETDGASACYTREDN